MIQSDEIDSLSTDYTSMTQRQRRVVRLKYIEAQDGKCWYCKNSLDGLPTEEVRNLDINKALFPIGFFNYPIHLHHCHNSGKTIGAVHSYCNSVMWQYHGT